LVKILIKFFYKYFHKYTGPIKDNIPHVAITNFCTGLVVKLLSTLGHVDQKLARREGDSV